MRTVLVMWMTKNQQRAITSSSSDVAQHSGGFQEARHCCFFFLWSRISGHDSISSRSIVSETTSEGFGHPTEQVERTIRVVSNCGKKQSCTRGVNTLRQNFTSVGKKTEGGTISIHYVRSDKLTANIFTKSLPVSILMGTGCKQSSQLCVISIFFCIIWEKV